MHLCSCEFGDLGAGDYFEEFGAKLDRFLGPILLGVEHILTGDIQVVEIGILEVKTQTLLYEFFLGKIEDKFSRDMLQFLHCRYSPHNFIITTKFNQSNTHLTPGPSRRQIHICIILIIHGYSCE